MNFAFSVKADNYTDQPKTLPRNRFTEPSAPNATYLKKLNLKLNTQNEEFEYTPTPNKFSYYQICAYVVDNMYQVRKIIYDDSGVVVSIRTNNIDASKIQNFIKKCPKNKYTILPVYELSGTELPDHGSILLAMSPILNNDNQ
jgi:hypothetical protein